uniref:CASP-like protein n=1 Tax=Mesocestoides corti TaxID=53468 RepID=A0A5K3FKD5_MESCO
MLFVVRAHGYAADIFAFAYVTDVITQIRFSLELLFNRLVHFRPRQRLWAAGGGGGGGGGAVRFPALSSLTSPPTHTPCLSRHPRSKCR